MRLTEGYYLPALSTMAKIPTICCHCGIAGFLVTPLQAALWQIPHPALFHNGSLFRDPVPLRQSYLRRRATYDAGMSLMHGYH